jgi:hypothetical protein
MSNKGKVLRLGEEAIEFLRYRVVRVLMTENDPKREAYFRSIQECLPNTHDLTYLKYGEYDVQFTRPAARAAAELADQKAKYIQEVMLPELLRRAEIPNAGARLEEKIAEAKKDIVFYRDLCYTITRSI